MANHFYPEGGDISNEDSGSECPLFLGYFEDSHFASPHYQSILPTRDSSVLKTVRENDGFDVALAFQFSKIDSDSGQFMPMCRLSSFSY